MVLLCKLLAGDNSFVKPSHASKLRETEFDVEDIGGESFGGVDDGLLPSPKSPIPPILPRRVS